jgi:hypothetical protein
MKYYKGGEINEKIILSHPDLFTKSSLTDLNNIMSTLKPVPIEEQKPITPKGGKVKRTRKLRRTKPRKSKRRK